MAVAAGSQRMAFCLCAVIGFENAVPPSEGILQDAVHDGFKDA
jgi:hypothetical protein